MSRLGLLTIVRQPKTAATYIQVSGRVGRVAKEGPGLVVVILSPLAGRDISHYERFTSFHNRLYEAVEPATVTPFTDAALERGVRGVVASVVRQTRPMEVVGAQVTAEDTVRAGAVVEQIADRAEALFDQAAATKVRTQWSLAADEMDAARTESLPWGTVNGHTRQFLRVASDIRDEDQETLLVGAHQPPECRRHRRDPNPRGLGAGGPHASPPCSGGWGIALWRRWRGGGVLSPFMFTPVRRAHLISPFGPGALQLSQNGVCGVTCGPPVWLESLKTMDAVAAATLFENQTIRDSHMERPLGVDRLIAPWPLGDDPGPRSDWFVPAARFPLYEYCVNHSCRALLRKDASDHDIGRCSRCTTGNRRKWQTVQVPVVLACSEGHLADVPWSRWLHEAEGRTAPSPTTSSSGLARSRPAAGHLPDVSTAPNAQPGRQLICAGERPWLPGLPPETCGRKAQVLERTSTAVYYPTTVSSLAVPQPGVDNPALVQKLHSSSAIRSQRRTYAADGSASSLDEIVRLCAQLGVRTEIAQVKRHLAALEVDRDEAEDRPTELDALLTNRPRPTEGTGSRPDRPAAEHGGLRGKPYHRPPHCGEPRARLREVRVLTGFNRIRPGNGSVDYEQLWGRPMSERMREGTELGGSRHTRYLARASCSSSTMTPWPDGGTASPRSLITVPWRKFGDPRGIPGPHSCPHGDEGHRSVRGYPLPSLRERIYDSDERLAFLIYTSAGDIQGTLGGLVELGRPGRLESLLKEATDRIRWCTTDPVCIEGSIELGLPDTTLAGACHHCLLLPETSCERGNRRLDRAAVIGIDGRGGLEGV